MKKLIICTFAMLIGFSTFGQVENEIDFRYMKAKYLIDTERYEEAIDAFQDIIQEDPNFKDAILLRAEAKYMMAAYSGTKNDVIEHVKNNGVTEAAIILLGKADYRLQRYDQAMKSLLVAASLNTSDPQVYEYIGDLYIRNRDSQKACEYWRKAAQMGSSTANISAQRECGSVSNVPTRDEVVVVEKPEIKDTRVPTGGGEPIDDSSKTTTGKIDGIPSDVVVVRKKDDSSTDDPYVDPSPDTGYDNTPPPPSNMPPDDVYPNVIKVDDELSLTIYGQGLGRRKVMAQPNILILSDTDGTVAVDICVNSRGKVESAELNNAESSIKKEHLVSLALRKSKEFWFEVSEYKEQCGTIIFDIKSL